MGPEQSAPPVGLDFGTSTTLIATGDEIVWIGSTYPWLPSLVGYDDNGTVVVGDEARLARPGQAIRSVKRAITRYRRALHVDAPGGLRDLSADDLIAEVLRAAVRRATARGVDLYAGPVQLGCPAMWDGRQRARLLDIARSIGLPVTSLVDEPVAAGIAWVAAQSAGAVAATRAQGPLRVLVFDMGGGTLDIAVLDVHGADRVSVLAAVGVDEAGDTLDDAIADDLGHALRTAGATVPRSHVVRELLLDAARTIKVGLTTEREYVVVLPPDVFGPNETWYTREQLDAAFAPQLDRAQECVASALHAARLTEVTPGAALSTQTAAAGVDVVLLCGGMSQIPVVRQRLRDLFPPATRIESASQPPETAVAAGLAKAGRFRRVNRYRPALGVLLEWGQQSRVVYSAYEPLVEPVQIGRGGPDLRYVRTGSDLDLPPEGAGRLRLLSPAGAPVQARLDGDDLDGFPVRWSGQKFEFSFYPSGHVRVVDAAGTHEGRVLDW